jgi:phosphatidylserine synthase
LLQRGHAFSGAEDLRKIMLKLIVMPGLMRLAHSSTVTRDTPPSSFAIGIVLPLHNFCVTTLIFEDELKEAVKDLLRITKKPRNS